MGKQKVSTARFHVFRFVAVIAVSLSIALFFIILGSYISKLLGQSKALWIFGLVAFSFPVTQIALYKLMKHMGKNFLKQ